MLIIKFILHIGLFLFVLTYTTRFLSAFQTKNSLDNCTQGICDVKLEEGANTNITTPFETLLFLPTALYQSQCVVHKHEILICGGYKNNECYSYNIPTNQYKRICFYPKDIELWRHCVVKWTTGNNSNDITLLSIGRQGENKKKHTLIMKYVSVWNKIEEDESVINNFEYYNEWLPFLDNNNIPIYIERDESDYEGMRIVIGGSNNHLLFITYIPKHIAVYDLNTFRYINRSGHCFVSRIENELITMETNNKQKNEMMLFCENTGLLIEYKEEINTFEFHKLNVCSTMRSLYDYAYLCINNIILFFGGSESSAHVSNAIHKYSIKEKKWMKFEHALPIPLCGCVGILSDDYTYIHILGGHDDNVQTTTHIKTNVNIWMNEESKIEKQWIAEEEEKREIAEIKIELNEIKESFDIKKLKVAFVCFFFAIISSAKRTEHKRKKRLHQHYNIGSAHCLFQSDGFMILISLFRDIFWYFEYIYKKKKQMKYFKPLKVLLLHSNAINSAKFSPDGTKMVITCDDRTIRIWDMTVEKETHMFKGHTCYIKDAQFSPDSNRIVSCSDDKTIRLWDIKAAIEIRKLEGHTDKVTSVQFSPDGATVVSCSFDKTVRIWDTASGQEIRRLEGHSDIVNDIQFSSNGQQLVSSSDDETIKIWDVKSGERTKELKDSSNYIMKTIFFPGNCQFIVSCSTDEAIYTWNIESGKKMQKLEGHSGVVRDVKFLPDKQTIVSCSDDQTIRLWDMKLGVEIQILKGHSDKVTQLDISSNGNMIVSSSKDGTIRLWKQL
ncbi:hypothetical protein RFI_02230 [Reticulomyxa filosa]|uniref:Uncharacterized protein n=1 Tax=Reticulomyxa filosa TaxID=46433 RepID=X6P8J1_RETFI|nr:hypothetical protein RFI_02230 [Reticulomyxa filosa]|eukprot:ETO34860.1 hypothetical protein RFI_02230 [Reticulomyxa filosa]